MEDRTINFERATTFDRAFNKSEQEQPMTDQTNEALVEEMARELKHLHLAISDGHYRFAAKELAHAILPILTRELAKAKADAEMLAGAVLEAAEQFDHYEQLHRAKGTPEGHEKANVNAIFAARLRGVVATYREKN